MDSLTQESVLKRREPNSMGGEIEASMIRADDFVPVTRSNNAHQLSRPSLSYWQDAWMRLKKNKQALASMASIIFLVLFSVIGPWFWPVDPSTQDVSRVSEAPTFDRTAKVIPDDDPWEEVVLSDFPATPAENDPKVEVLPAPETIEIVGNPTTQAVRVKWSPVTGASGYVVYRGTFEPRGHEELGLPIFEVDGANRVSYEDRFNLEDTTYYYSVVPKSDVEGVTYKTVKVEVPNSITISSAQLIDPNATVGQVLKLSVHPFGTDYLGRDMMARLMYGGRISLFIGFFGPLIYVLIGVIIGGVSGYLGGRADNWIMRFTDLVIALPFLLFMILFKVVFGGGPGESGILPMLVALIILAWTGAARLTRGQVLQLRESEFVHAARLLGAKPSYLIARHLLPNTMGVILVTLTFQIPSAIFTEAFLSFIGMGVAPPTPSWGSMCNEGILRFLTNPHEFIFPSIFIIVSVLAFNLFGDGLRDALDPRLRSRE